MKGKETKYIKIDPADPSKGAISEAGTILRNGGLVAFPTETVYGLGANVTNSEAVAAIFKAKGRPADNPLIVHISDVSQVYDLSDDVTVPAQRVMEAFWPGPLTVVLSKKPGIPDGVTAGLSTVAVRMPDHPVALELIKAAGVPLAAPSANTSGKPSPTTAQHVLQDLTGKIDMVVDGGACRVGLESTVLDLTSEPPVILRPGGVTRDDIEGILGRVEMENSAGDKGSLGTPRSPGMKYTHYSPRADVVVVTGEDYTVIFEKVAELIADYRAKNQKAGVLASTETARGYCSDEVFTVGSRARLETVAQNLFYGLRYLDEEDVDVIIAEGYPESGIGIAIMNRLKKAAGNKVIYI
ncbi:MAG: L-threonylcarbamoyladenylate synthase [Firmicutes bacterium]|nr:L-threonylcarbamoyladenylate synthase [Bacillota bacterium]